jgi:hypothetical protein
MTGTVTRHAPATMNAAPAAVNAPTAIIAAVDPAIASLREGRGPHGVTVAPPSDTPRAAAYLPMAATVARVTTSRIAHLNPSNPIRFWSGCRSRQNQA